MRKENDSGNVERECVCVCVNERDARNTIMTPSSIRHNSIGFNSIQFIRDTIRRRRVTNVECAVGLISFLFSLFTISYLFLLFLTPFSSWLLILFFFYLYIQSTACSLCTTNIIYRGVWYIWYILIPMNETSSLFSSITLHQTQR